MKDKIIEFGDKKYSLKSILNESSWEKYIKGSKAFKRAVEIGVLIQIAQVERLHKKKLNPVIQPSEVAKFHTFVDGD